MLEQQLINLLIDRLTDLSHKNKQIFISNVAIWIAKIFLSETKIEITHEYDPPWDSSGITYNTNLPFEIEEYTSLSSFIETELNGQSNPTFISGFGMGHDTYSKELDELIDEWIISQLKETIDVLLRDKSKILFDYLKMIKAGENGGINTPFYSADDITNSILFDDIIGDFITFDFPGQLRDKVLEADLKFLVRLGLDQAKEELQEEEFKRQKYFEQEKYNQERAIKYWEKICILHRVKYQKNMPQKVDKAYYDNYVHSILENEYKEGANIENIQFLGKYLDNYFSNSVACLLSRFKNN